MRKKVYEYDILRIIAIFMVVIGHSAYTTIATSFGGVNYLLPENISGAYYSNVFIILRFLSGWVYKFHMPLFFLLSGAVYKIVEKPDESLDTLVVSKVKRLIIPYFLAGALFMFPIKLWCNFYNSQSIFLALGEFWKGVDSGHLWFLLALFWCFILFYICNKYVGKKSIFLLLILSFIMQQYYTIINVNICEFQKGVSYLFWFSLGYCFELKRKKINVTSKWIFFIVCVTLMIMDYLNGYFLDEFVSIIIYSFAMYLLADLIYTYFYKIVNTELYNIVSRNAMFIYLFHDPLEYVCLKVAFHFNLLTYNWGCHLYLISRTIGVIIASILLGEAIASIKNRLSKSRLHLLIFQ